MVSSSLALLASLLALGVATTTVEAVAASSPAGAIAEPVLVALELLCMVAEGAAAVRGHTLAVLALAGAVE